MEEWQDKCDYSSLHAPAKNQSLRVVRAYVASVAGKFGFDASESANIARAVHEAAKNVIEHAFEPHEEGVMEISCERVAQGIMIGIRDKGLPFEPPGPHDSGLPQEPATTGFPLMYELMDRVIFNNLGREGKEIRLVKNSGAMSPEEFDEFRRFESEAPRIDSGKTYSNEELHIRLLEPSEAAQISRAIYKSYGATYFYEDVYYPDRVKNFIETGRQVSAGAFISNGEMVGHCALMDIEWRAASAELGQAVVDPEFRGKGCLGRLSDFLTLEAVNMGLTGLMAQAVTTHGFSQKILYKLNFSHCGLLLAHAPEGLTFRGLQERPSEHRESKEILYKRITVQNPGVIYPPPGHDRFMKRMFSNIHAEPRVAVPSVSLPVFDRDSSEIEIESHAFIPKGYALIKIKSLGPDIVDAVRKQVGSLCRNNIKVITLYLKLSDPMTYHLGRSMEELGFNVTGIMPGTEMGDVMVMQYFNNLRIDFESIDLYSEEARRTMDYIRRRLKM